MGNPNYGKDFEEEIKKAFLREPFVDVQRLYDTTNGFTGIKQPSDFIVYKYPYQYYIECKTTWENTLRKDKLTQLDTLLKKQEVPGVVAGFMVWYIKHDTTVFIPVATVYRHLLKYKSINIKDIQNNNLAESGDYFYIDGQKRRVFYDYYMDVFFKEVEDWMRMLRMIQM